MAKETVQEEVVVVIRNLQGMPVSVVINDQKRGRPMMCKVSVIGFSKIKDFLKEVASQGGLEESGDNMGIAIQRGDVEKVGRDSE